MVTPPVPSPTRDGCTRCCHICHGGHSQHPPPEYFLDWIIVAPRNDDDDMRNKFLSTMHGKEQVFYDADTVTQEAGAGNETFGVNTFPVGPIHSLATSNLPPGEL